MALNIWMSLLVTVVMGTPKAQAQNNEQLANDYLTVSSVEIRKVSKDFLNQEVRTLDYLKHYQIDGVPEAGKPDPAEKVGKIIAIAKDLVALGEDVYKLVIKGKPTNKVDYAPISVIPSVKGAPVEILDTEGWKVPRKDTYEVIYKNPYGMEVVKFRYSVIFAYGGSYEGKGSYLTAVQIIPEIADTLFGYDFTATMKLGGIMNHGTKATPVAGATLLMETTVKTILKASLEVYTYHVTGLGQFKQI